jgi:luciferase family oxidoreductase group 1
MALTLSVLDQSPIRSGSTAADAIRETIALARACETLGYRRYWLAEHHSSGGLAGSAPEVLIAAVAAATSTIRVGSGGVMLPHYSAYKEAEAFRVLETLHPGRIDLGIGRAPGSDQLTAMALRPERRFDADEFPQQLMDLQGWLSGRLAPGHPFEQVTAQPVGPTVPEIWMLGTSDGGAAYAAHFGLAFSFAQFIAGASGAAVVKAYRQYFQPSDLNPAPRASAAIFAIAAATAEEAEYLGRSRQMWLLRQARGQFGPFPSPEEALAHSYTTSELAYIRQQAGRSIIGSVEQVKARLEALAAEYAVDELVIVTITHDPAARRRSYELLAEAFGLKPPTAAV